MQRTQILWNVSNLLTNFSIGAQVSAPCNNTLYTADLYTIPLVLQCQIRCSKDRVPETAKHYRCLCNLKSNFTSYSTTCFNQRSQIFKLTNYLKQTPIQYHRNQVIFRKPNISNKQLCLCNTQHKTLFTNYFIKYFSTAKTTSSLLEHTRAASSTNKHSDCTKRVWSPSFLSNQLPTQLKLHYQTCSSTSAN